MQEILNILSSVGFNWHVALANFVNFLIILFLLNVFFFKKLGKTINTRKQVIERGLNQARDAEKSLASAEEEGRQIVQSAKKERETILTEGHALAQEIALTVAVEAQKTIDERLAKLALDEKNLEASIEKSFRERAPHIVAAMYKKTLIQELSETDNNALIARMHS